MRKIKVQQLTIETFNCFGSYVNMVKPSVNFIGEKPCLFYRDPVTMPIYGAAAAFSVCEVFKQEKMIINAAEYHNYTGEVIMPLDDDAIVHVAPATGKIPVPDETVAFYVPKGTLLKLNAGVWHLAPFAVHADVLHNLIVLPERVYANDCYVVQYDEKDWMEIELQVI